MKLTPEILSSVRWVLTIIGTLAASSGWVAHEDIGPLVDTLMPLIGGAVAVGALIWGIYQKRLQKKEVAVAQITPATPAVIAEAKEVLTNKEVERAMSPTLAPATVTATGKVV